MLRTLLPYPRGAVVLTLVLLAAVPACARETSVQTPSSTPADSLAAPYAFDRPDTVFRLPNRLREISGLTVLDDQTLGAVEDEHGRLYLIDLNTGEVKDDPRFEDDGDYEGLARVEERVFVLKSNGTLYEIKDWRAKKLDTRTHKTKLKARHDTEGLAYDAARARLLIACKEYPGEGLRQQKAIYAFDLARETLLDDPVYTIDVEAFTEQAGSEGGLNDRARRALPALDLSGFKPSALAVHPVTGEVYVLSSVRKAVAVLHPEGALAAVWPLPDDLFPQPEGMAFLPGGDLFIASEGAGGKARLARFAYRP